MASSTSNIVQMVSGDNVAKVVNGQTDASSPSTYGARNFATCSALTWGYLGGYVNVNGVPTSVANGTLTLSASTTNYIESNPSTGAIAKVTTRTAGYELLYTVTTSASAATSYTDHRMTRDRGIPYITMSIAGSSDTTLTADQSDPYVQQYVFTGAVTGNKSVIVPLTYRPRTYVNSTTGDFTVTVKGPTGTGVLLPRGAVVTLMSDGTNFVRKSDTGVVSGGSVTQATSKATGVTLNTLSGQITLDAASLASATLVSFTLTNSAIGADDHIVVHRKSAGTATSYRVWCDSVAAGSCVIAVENITGGALAEAVVLGFRVLRGSL